MDIDLHTRPATACRFAGGAGEAGRSHVLNAGDGIGGKQLKAGLQEKLLTERVAHLDSRAVGLRLFGQFPGCKSRSGQSVTAGLGTHVEYGIAHPLGSAAGDLLVPENAKAEGVHQRVPIVTVVEIDLSGDCRQADAVAVVCNAGNHTGKEAAVGFRLI